MAQYEYLSNPDILKYIDSLKRRVQWTRVIVLNWQDLPIKAIEGRATAGSISINGKSAVRRTGSLTLVTEVDPKADELEIMHEVTNIKTLISINKRIQVEVGILNNGGLYSDFDIFWMPLGNFLISNASVAYNNQGISISLKLSDKMALLNGEAGGVIEVSTIHSPIEDKVTEKESYVKVRDLITTFVRDWGGIPEHRIVIDDIPNYIETAVKWEPNGENKYLIPGGETSDGIQIYKSSSTNQEGGYQPQSLVGYVQTEFTYPGSLASNAGETVVQVLDKIKNKLGNYEYFFDMDGIFHFQEIKNYLNEGSAIENLGEAINEKYFLNVARGKASYNFTDSALITTYVNNPQYNQIKNDYQVWGVVPDTIIPIQYHLTIQKLPGDYEKNYWRISFYRDKNGVLRAAKARSFISLAEAENAETEFCIVLVNPFIDNEDTIVVDSQSVEVNEKIKEGYLIIEPVDEVINLSNISSDAWRLKMYFMAIEENDTSSFAKEIIEKIPQMMNIKTGEINPDTKYYLDGINTNDSTLMIQVPIKGLGVDDIGRRTKVINDENINCLFAPSPENKVFSTTRNLFIETLKEIALIQEADYNQLSSSITYKSAYDVLRSSIHEHLSYNNNINITSMPIYHLDANQRIFVFNEESNIQGDYIIQSITIPLTLSGMMTINAVKAVERI